MKPKLNARTGLLTVLLYLVLSLAATFIGLIFFGGLGGSESEPRINDLIDGSMVGNLLVAAVLVYLCVVVFKDSKKDIFSERTKFQLSKLYYLIPLAELGGALVALASVDFAGYTIGTLLLVAVATLTIGFNEEVVTRGILLVGLRNSGVAEWLVWLITVLVFTLLHVVNLFAGLSVIALLVQVTGGTTLYVARRVSNGLLVPILLHAFYDFAFFLLPGLYPAAESVPDSVLDIQFGAFLVSLLATLLFLLFGRRLLKSDTTGWEQTPVVLEPTTS